MFYLLSSQVLDSLGSDQGTLSNITFSVRTLKSRNALQLAASHSTKTWCFSWDHSKFPRAQVKKSSSECIHTLHLRRQTYLSLSTRHCERMEGKNTQQTIAQSFLVWNRSGIFLVCLMGAEGVGNRS